MKRDLTCVFKSFDNLMYSYVLYNFFLMHLKLDCPQYEFLIMHIFHTNVSTLTLVISLSFHGYCEWKKADHKFSRAIPIK